MARLAQVIKKLNIGLSTAVEFLNKKGEQLENNPNTKLTDEQEALLVKEFSTAETVKLEADRLNHLRQEKEKVVEEAPVAHGGLCHARPGRGHGGERPDHCDEPGPDCAEGLAPRFV